MYSKKNLQRIQQQAERYYAGYAGSQKDKLIGSDDEGYAFYNPQNGQSIEDVLPEIEETDSEIVLTVTNAAVAAKKAVVFGGFLAFGKANFGNDADITIAAKGTTSYGEILAETMSGGIYVKGLRMAVTTVNQFDNSLTLIQKSSGGQTISNDFFPNTKGDEYRQDNKRVTVNGFEFLATGGARIEFEVLPSEVVTLIFKIRTRFEQKNLFKGKPGLAIRK